MDSETILRVCVEHINVFPQNFLRTITKGLLRCLVKRDDVSFHVNRDDRVQGTLDEIPGILLRRPQGFLRPHPLGQFLLSRFVQPRVLNGIGGIAGKGLKTPGVNRREKARGGAIHVEKSDHLVSHTDGRACIGAYPLLYRHVHPPWGGGGIGSDHRGPVLHHLCEVRHVGNRKDGRGDKFL